MLVKIINLVKSEEIHLLYIEHFFSQVSSHLHTKLKLTTKYNIGSYE